MQRLLRTIIALATGVSALVAGAAEPASAATEIDWFVATPGYIRTDLIALGVASDPATGSMYVVSVTTANQFELLKLEVERLTVQARVILATAPAGYSGFVDVEVAPDGDRVYVVLPGKVISMRPTDLGGRTTVSIPGPVAPWRIEVAPGRSQRAIVWANNSTYAFRVDGATVTQFPPAAGPDGSFTFGADADTVFNYGASMLRRFDVSVGVDLVQENLTPLPTRLPEHDMMFVAGWLWLDWIKIDPDSFAPVATALPPIPDDPYDVVHEHGRITLRGQYNSVTTFDVTSGSLVQVGPSWYLPTTAGGQTWPVDIGDGEFAVLEFVRDRSDLPTEYRLSLASPSMLTSAFGEYHPVTPTRLLDTRDGTGEPSRTAPLGPGESITMPLRGRPALPSSGLLAVTLNVTVTQPTAPSYFSLWPAGEPTPEISNLNFGPEQTIANSATVVVGDDDSIQLLNGHGSAHVVIDVVGYYVDDTGEPGARYFPNRPLRLVDTRYDNPRPRLQAGESVEVTLWPPPIGEGSLVAAVLNVTAVVPDAAGYLIAHPADEPPPLASSLNFAPGDVRPNLVVVKTSADGRVRISNPIGSTDVLVDLLGVYKTFPDQSSVQTGRLYPTSPFRRFDSRVASPFDPPGSLTPGSAIILGGEVGWTYLTNVAAVDPTTDGYLNALGWESDSIGLFLAPTTSTVNFSAGETVSNGAYLVPTPDYAVYNAFGETHVIVDVFGFLTGPLPPAYLLWD